MGEGSGWGRYTVKKVSDFPVTSLNITRLFPARDSLVSDIPAGYRKIAKLFLQCGCLWRALVGMLYDEGKCSSLPCFGKVHIVQLLVSAVQA